MDADGLEQRGQLPGRGAVVLRDRRDISLGRAGEVGDLGKSECRRLPLEIVQGAFHQRRDLLGRVFVAIREQAGQLVDLPAGLQHKFAAELFEPFLNLWRKRHASTNKPKDLPEYDTDALYTSIGNGFASPLPSRAASISITVRPVTG